MTAQYDQDNINLRDASPISIQTVDVTAVPISLGGLPADGETLTVNIYGGGSEPGDLAATNYSMMARATFVREAGVVTVAAVSIDISGSGATFTFTVDGDTCQIEIVGLATPVNHRLKVSTIGF